MRRFSAILCLLTLAACVDAHRPSYTYWQHGPYHPPPISLPDGRNAHYMPDRIDGSYQGTAYLTSAPNLTLRHWWHKALISSEVCPNTTMGVVEIDGGMLTYAFNPNLIFSPMVGKDGSFYQQVGEATMWGKVKNDRLSFNVVTPLCTLRFFGNYKDNHSF